MESEIEREQLLAHQTKPAVPCDIVNECQMFLKAEEGGGDAHVNMKENVEAGQSGNIIVYTFISHHTIFF